MFAHTLIAIVATAQAVLAGAQFGCQNVCQSVGGGVGTTPNCGQGQHYWRHKRDESGSYCFGGSAVNRPLAGNCQNARRDRPVWFSNDGSDCSYLNGGVWYMDNGVTIVQEQNGQKYWCVSGAPGFATESHTPPFATCHAS